jgi:ABC-type glycerol-3-phosphate transport system substrate-binding protein
MKKAFLVVLAVLVCTSLFAGGQQGSGGASADGLTTIKVWGHNKQYFVTGGSFTLSDWYDGTVKSKLWDRFVEDLAKRGIKLDLTLVMADQMETAFQTLVASGEINNYDWVSPINFTDTKGRYNLIDQKLLLPLDTAIEQYSDGTARNYFNTNPAGQLMKKLNTVADGHMYWLSQTDAFYYGNPNNVAGEPQGGGIREDWLRRLNLPVPTTLDELYDTFVAFQTRDANMNGIKDEVAQISTTGFETSLAGFFGLGSGNAYILGNKVLSSWYQPHAQDYITFVNKLYKANLLKLTNEGNELAADKIGYMGQYFQDTYNDQQIIAPAGQPNAYTRPIVIQAYRDTPALVYEQPGVNQYFGSGMYVIPAKSKNVAAVVKLIDYIHTPEYVTLGEWGIEGYTYKVNSDGTWERFPINSDNVGYDQHMTSMAEALPFACWQAPFPRMRKGDKHDILQSLIDAGRSRGYPEGFAIKNDYLVDYYENHKWPIYNSPTGADGKLAFPTAAESDRQAQILPDLNTYCSELMTALVMGEKSLSNWNTYMADLKRLGLDELMSIYQARLDRASR